VTDGLNRLRHSEFSNAVLKLSLLVTDGLNRLRHSGINLVTDGLNRLRHPHSAARTLWEQHPVTTVGQHHE
jgi:hypothetical protein